MPKYYDISRALSPAVATWAGDTPFSMRQNLSIEDGNSVNLSQFSMSIHTATHIDAPYHFDTAGQHTQALDLSVYWGLAQVIEIDKPAGEAYTPADLAGIDLQAPRLLIRSGSSAVPDTTFPQLINYPSPEFVAVLAGHDIILLGTDAPSMDAITDPALGGHKALAAANIAILEGLTLGDVPLGLYELSALPLKLSNPDGSPVRAVLRTRT